MIVYVVTYHTKSSAARDTDSGYDFFLGSERKKAVQTMVDRVNHSNNQHTITFQPLDVPVSDRAAVKNWLDNHPEVTEGR